MSERLMVVGGGRWKKVERKKVGKGEKSGESRVRERGGGGITTRKAWVD